ncbi:TAF-domain-containing protein [Neoconidiobolus thromboides FSU 785]|nr:TAF-domain-containing protein [Neoconidiobolus thromboides FSU 785]
MDTNTVYPIEAIEEVGDSLGLSSIPKDGLSSLADDVEFRIKEVVQEAIKFMKHGKRERLTLDDINLALRVRSVEPLYGFNSSGGLRFNSVKYSNQELYYLQDKDIELETLLSTPLPPAPMDLSFTAHWLAVEGIQPLIPQNPIERDEPDKFLLKKSKISINSTIKPIDNLTSNMDMDVKPIVKHNLSRELRKHFENLASALVAEDIEVQKAAHDSLNKDPGLQQLLPYFIQYISEKTVKSFDKINILKSLLTALEMIMLNSYFFITPYLHQICPVILTCLITKRMGNNMERELSHWQLRHQASDLLRLIYQKIEFTHPNARPKIVKTLFSAIFDPQSTITTFYGGILGIKTLSDSLFDSCIPPNLNSISMKLQSFNGKEESREIIRCMEMIVDFLADAAENKKYLQNESAISIVKLNQLIPYQPLAQEIIKSQHFKSICVYLNQVIFNNKNEKENIVNVEKGNLELEKTEKIESVQEMETDKETENKIEHKNEENKVENKENDSDNMDSNENDKQIMEEEDDDDDQWDEE